MPVIRKNIIVDVPAETVWAVLVSPARTRCLNPDMKPVCFFESKLGGYDSLFEYRMGGKWLRVKSCLKAYQQGVQLAYRTSGELHSSWEWWLESDGSWTHASLRMSYDLPPALAGTDVAVLEDQMALALEAVLVNLKRISEAWRAA